MSNRTNAILSKIMETAGVDQENFSGSDAAILRLLRYYRQDIPAAPRYLYDGDAVSFYYDDAAVNAVQDEKSKQWLAERGDVMTSLWVPLTTFLGRMMAKLPVRMMTILITFCRAIRKGTRRCWKSLK